MFDGKNLQTNRTILMTYKHKTHVVDIDGKIVSNADVDFYVNEVCCFIILVLF